MVDGTIDPQAVDIRRRRLAIGQTRNALARMAGISPNVLKAAEGGRSRLLPEHARRVLRVLVALEAAHRECVAGDAA